MSRVYAIDGGGGLGLERVGGCLELLCGEGGQSVGLGLPVHVPEDLPLVRDLPDLIELHGL